MRIFKGLELSFWEKWVEDWGGKKTTAITPPEKLIIIRGHELWQCDRAFKSPCVKTVRFWKSSCKIFIFPTYCLSQNFMPTILNFYKNLRKENNKTAKNPFKGERQNVRHYFTTWCLWLLKSFPLTQRWIPYGLMANIKKQSMLTF